MTFYSPLKYLKLTADFKSNHVANDLGWSKDYGGSKVDELAMADGIVEKIYETETGGNAIAVKFDDEENTWYSCYRHCSKILVNEKQWLLQGQPIAKMGATGSMATGSHLHVELMKCPKGTPYEATDAFRKKYAVNPREVFFCTNDNILNEKTRNKFRMEPEPELKVGDKVKIVAEGNSQASGKGKIAKGIGWKRQIKEIYENSPYPYKVGNSFGTTGFYKREGLERI